MLRNSLLLSTLLSNSESWYNLTIKDIKDLESICRCQIHEESIIKSRRLNFLWYILQQEPNSLLNKFFSAQLANPKNGDWVLTVKNDLGKPSKKREY